ncbi:MAG TPA: AAA family ATPase [Phycisphaerae bacterium]|nr:AAA family ATPase [Phycisphaerae bacterium]
MPDFVEELKLLIRTRHSLVTVRTTEEDYASRLIRQAGRDLRMTVLEWTVTEGLRQTSPNPGGTIAGTDNLASALGFIRDNVNLQLYVLKDAMGLLGPAVVQRTLREAAEKCARDTSTIFLIDVGGDLPPALHHLAVPFEIALPSEEEVRSIAQQTLRDLCAFGQGQVEITKRGFEQFLANLRGLTRSEIARVVTETVLADGKLGPDDVEHVVQAKRTRLRQTGVLDYVPPPESRPEVGGMANLRGWLTRREEAFTSKAASFGLEPPRGILMLGVQGCGKSLMARYVAGEWRMPLLKMDVGVLYDKFVGETERHLREAFAIAAGMAPCVLWIDEIEKAFASPGGPMAGVSDGGLSQRVFGQLLTWMQDRPEPVFLVATANDVSALPPEMLRKGRFDEVFFVDLPAPAVRRDIFAIHLRKRGRPEEGFDLDALAAASEGFSGAEIEQAIVSALYAAFHQRRDLTCEDVLAELAATRPLSVLMAERIDALRAWAADRCVPAD